ncbi:hypothetical protein P7H12_00115 [Paenibacillus larvae]|nr:hypothetical protein [Paenibacillus larvae]MDT2262377.1 hypothetical protein [Paenibacillus larvae]
MAKLAPQINGMLTDRIEVETTGPDQVDVEALNQRLVVQGPSYTTGGLDGQYVGPRCNCVLWREQVDQFAFDQS